MTPAFDTLTMLTILISPTSLLHLIFCFYSLFSSSNLPLLLLFSSFVLHSTSFLHPILPSFIPSFLPSFIPSFLPSFIPSFLPSFIPSFLPSFIPSFLPLSLLLSHFHTLFFFLLFFFSFFFLSNSTRQLLIQILRIYNLFLLVLTHHIDYVCHYSFHCHV